MKANEAPEKIWIDPANDLPKLSGHIDKNSVEYIRKDAFIEKAVKWIEEINNYHHIMRYSDSCEPPLSELTEWFRNYMKGE
jgi:hypothetical protein